jgi:hypothetical protein
MALALLVPAIHYSDSRTGDDLVGLVLASLAILSMPASFAYGAVVSIVRSMTGLFAYPDTSGDFVVWILWCFTVGYLQWYLPFRVCRWIDRRLGAENQT